MKDDIKVAFCWLIAIFVVVCYTTGWPFAYTSKTDMKFAPTTRPLMSPSESFNPDTVVTSVPAEIVPAPLVTTTTVVEQTAPDSSSTVPPVPSTTAPSPQVAAKQVSRGAQHSCWLESGAPVCTGYSYYGETNTNHHFGPVKQVEAGDARTCVLEVAGDVYCWGYRTGEDASSSLSPVQVPLPGPAVLLSSGLGQECAAVESAGGEQIWCWGEGYDREAGGYTGKQFADTREPVLMWSGRHVHSMDVKYRTAEAHVGLFDGTCVFISWGEHSSTVVVEPMS